MVSSVVQGTHCKFTLKKDDSRLIAAIKGLGVQGEDILDTNLHQSMIQGMIIAKKALIREAGALAGVEVGPTLGFGKSKQIHVKVAEALKVFKVKKLEYSIHSGKSYREREIGVLGQRKGKLSHIVASGMKSFNYGMLPPLVKSSARWFKESGGNRNWMTYGMKMRRVHPGFYQTVDYITLAHEKAHDDFIFKADLVVRQAAVRAGFSLLGGTKG